MHEDSQMSSKVYAIGDKEYTREELLAFGKAHYPKFYWIFRGSGLGLMAIGFFFAIMFVILAILSGGADSPVDWVFYIYAIPFGFIGITGAVLFSISFRKKPDEAYIKHAIDYYSKLDARTKQREKRVAEKKENRDISQLLKYKELLDAGIITQEEFEKKKKEYLDN